MELSMWDGRVPAALKMWANAMVTEAVRRNLLVRPKVCSRCSKGDCAIHAHHPDYSRPLDVVWLCVGCHGGAHSWREAPTTEALAERLEIAMVRHGYRYGYIAKCLGISNSTVRSWHSGFSRVYLQDIEAIEKLRPYEEQEDRDNIAAALRKWRVMSAERGRHVHFSPKTGQIG